MNLGTTYLSHLYLSAPFNESMATNFFKACWTEKAPWMSMLRSRMLSNVSLLYPQLMHVTLDRSFPPKILCTHVVSASFGSIFLFVFVVVQRLVRKSKGKMVRKRV